MKKLNTWYWIITVIFAAFMAMSGVQNLLSTPDSIKMLSTEMGYPQYFVPFIGFAKLLGAIAILIPGFPRIKEWAYAGLFFDLTGAVYSSIATYGLMPDTFFMLIFFLFFAASYILYHKKLKFTSANNK